MRRALQDHTERAVRAALREIPDGRYTFEDALDDDGFSDEPLKIAVAVTVSRQGAIGASTSRDPIARPRAA